MADVELVIKIPKEQYALIMQLYKDSKTYLVARFVDKEAITTAINNGTPLPKGHGRLIDTDELYNSLVFPTQQFAVAFKQVLNDAPTIIEADAESEVKE